MAIKKKGGMEGGIKKYLKRLGNEAKEGGTFVPIHPVDKRVQPIN